MLQAQNVTVRYGDKTAVDSVSFSLEPGQWLMLAGPNGAGKSTLIGAVAQSVAYEGRVLLDGKDMSALRSAQRARQMAVLSQRNAAQYGYTVEEIVQLGRYAYRRGFLGREPDADRQGIERALALTGLQEYRRRSILDLSGGEMQRVFLAQVFAQDPNILLLDEPANHLDLPYQQHIFGLIREWVSQPGKAVLSVVHDLSLAKKYGTHALLMHRGRCVAQGETDAVLTRENLRQVYEMDVYAWMRGLLSQWRDNSEEFGVRSEERGVNRRQ